MTLSAGAFAGTVHNDYDALGRLRAVTYPDGSTVSYTYDAAGNRTQLTQAIPGPSGTFGASPTSIIPGGSSTLSWTSTHATSASIDNGVGSVTPVAGGSISVSPTTNTTYTLTLTGTGGTVTYQTTVTVGNGALSASPASINQGSSSTLTWSSVNATAASIDNGVGSVSPIAGGSVSVTPSTTTTYTLTLTTPGGTVTKQATVT